jgi:Proteasome activator pa28 beta subunit
LDVVAKAPDTVAKLQASYQQHFASAGSPSALYASFSSAAPAAANPTCEAAVLATQDAADHVLVSCALLGSYVQLAVPKIEDGGNFGVSIQLDALKVIADQAEKVTKAVEDLYGYAAARADVLEKCKLPTVAKSKTESDTNGTDKEKGEVSSKSIELKVTESTNEFAEAPLRAKALAAVDVKYFVKAKSTYQMAIGAFLAVVDFVDKNKVKIDKPRDNESNARGYSSTMY